MVRPNLTFLLDESSFSRRTLFGLVLLILAGYLGNYFHWTLFFSIDFLFGSIAVWLVVCLYGTAWGTVAGFVAATCTYVLWNHPYAVVTFTLEAFFVGFLFHRKRKSIVLLDAIFWLVIGTPWIWISYPVLMHVDLTQTQFIVLKQAVNGLFNAIVASQLLTYLPIQRWVPRPPVVNQFPLQQTLFNLLVAFVFFPTLILILLASHRVVDDIKADAKADLNAASRYLVAETRAWYQQQLQAVSILAELAETNQLNVLQEKVNFDQQTFAHFQAFYIIKPDGTVIQSTSNPTFHIDQNHPSITPKTFNPPFLKQLSPIVQFPHPTLLVQRRLAQPPLIFFYTPLKIGGEARFLLGFLNRSNIDALLHSKLEQQDLQITLVDHQKTVITSTQVNRLELQNFDRRKTGVTHVLDAETYHWLPTTGISAAMTQWKKSFFVQETLIDPATRWTLIVETPAEPRVHYVEKVYSQNLTLLLMVAGLALILANFVSRYFVKPLTQLTVITTNLPNKLLEQEVVTWAPSPITEVALLTHNFQFMANSLKQKFGEIQQINETLERRIQERTRALLQVNAELEAEITERKQAETALQELSLALANAMPGIARLSAGQYLDVNDAYAQIMGYRPDEMIGMGWEPTVYAADLSIAIAAYERMLADGKGEFEARGVRKDGSCFYKQILMVKASAETAGFEGHYCFCRDISDRKQVEETLRRSQSNLLAAQRVAHIGNWEFDLKTQTIIWSEEVFRICGLDPTQPEPTYEELLQLYHPDDAERLQQAVERSISTGEPYDFDLRLFLPDGSLRYINSRGQAVCDLEGHAVRLFGTAQDVTDRVQAEVALRQSEEQNRALLNAIPDLMIRMSRDGTILEYKSPSHFKAYASKDVCGKNVYEVLPPDIARERLYYAEQALQTGKIQIYELQLTIDGETRTNEVRLVVCGEMDVLAIVRDISDRKRIEDERKQAEIALRQSEATNRALISAIPDLLLWIHQDGTYLDALGSSKSLVLNRPMSEMIGAHIYDILPPSKAQERMHYVQQALQTNELQVYEYQLEVEGDTRDEEARIVVCGEQHVLCMVRDITDRKRAEGKVRQLNEDLEQRVAQRTAELESLINAMPDYIYVIDRDEMRVSFCNDVFAQATGDRSRQQVKGKTLFECFATETAAYFIQQNNQVFESGLPLHQQERLNLPIGLRHFETFKIPLRTPNGQVYALLGTSRDNTSLMEIQQTLSERTTQLEAVNRTLEQRNQEMTLLSQMSDLLQACLNQAESRTVMVQLLPRLFPDCSGAVFLINDSHNLVEEIAHFGSDTSQMLFAPHDCFALRRGQPHFVEDTCHGLCCKHLLNPFPDSYFCIPMVARGKAIGVLYLSATGQELFTPVTRQLAATAAQQIGLALANLKLYETLQNQSIRDPLTGLFNRRYLEETLARELHRAQRSQNNLSIIVIDVDHFKRFNDTFGHDAGDAILRELGRFLQSSVRGSDTACRFGGEEMVLILPDATLDDARERAEQLRQSIKQLTINHHQPVGSITVSLGVACFPNHAASRETLMKAADEALYRAKAEGRDLVITANQS